MESSCKVLVLLAVLQMVFLCHLNQATTAQISSTTEYIRPENSPNTTLYIRPEHPPNTTCPGLPCETLDYYANVSHVNTTQFIFLSGVHKLRMNFTLCNLLSIQLVGSDTEEHIYNSAYPTPQVHCNATSSAGFIFQNVSSLTIKNLNIVYCGQMIPKTVYSVSLPVQAAVAMKQVSTLTMHSVTVQNSSGYGLVAEGLYDNSNITNCRFQYNHGSEKYIGGNVAILYKNCPGICSSTQNNITIYNTTFSQGRNYRIDSISAKIAASGLILNMSCANINILLSHVILEFNKASSFFSRGGNLCIVYDNSYSNSTRISLKIKHSLIANGTAFIGGGVYLDVKSISNVQDCNPNSQQVHFLFENTTFKYNHGSHWGGALYISTFVPDGTINKCPSGGLNITNCTFNRNFVRTRTADAGVAIHAYQYSVGVSPSSLPWFNITIQETHFRYNKLRSANKLHSRIKGGGVLYIAQHRKEVHIVNSTFEHSKVTAISLFRSNVVFKGNILLSNNTGIDGGALVLCEESYMLLSANTTLTIQNNTALDSGGGIYAQDQCLESNLNCFYQVYLEGNQTFTSVVDTVKVIMINNTANSAGSQIYGGNLDHCRNSLTGELALPSYGKIFNESLWQYSRSTDLSYVTSKPRSVCFCDSISNQPDCSKTDWTIEHEIFPGQYVTVSVVAVGQFNHTVPAIVIAEASTHHKTVKDIEAVCTPINLTVLSNKSHEHVVLLVSTNEGYRPKREKIIGGLDPRYLHINYTNCPLGFVRTSKGDCDCPSNYVNCNITSQTITVRPPAWVGFNYANTSKDGTVDGMILYYQCPPDYCVPNGTNINTNNTLFDQNAQCLYNRGGVLCGACLEGYSLSLGTHKCVPCQNSYARIALVVFIISVIGILCLVFIIACNITITDCTLSGLIFYANVIKLDCLPVTPNQNFLLRFFIEWLNLESGVGSYCFYEGYDGYTRTLLQFTTPLLLWIVMGIIIFLSSKSSRIAALVGRNAVKVLATLFLLSYTQILQAEVDVFTCVRIFYPTTNKTIIKKHLWYRDATVPCWQGKHLGLVVIGALFGIAAIVYTLILLFVQPLQRYSHHKPLRWVARLKPFIDAYTCPHVIKDRYRFWMGLLLLFRLLSSLVSTSSFKPLYISMLSVLILTLAWSFGGVYKKWWLKVLNASSFLNLIFLSMTTYYNGSYHTATNKEATISSTQTISLSIALATFLIVLVYHILKRLKEIGVFNCCMTKLSRTQLWQILSTRYKERRYQRVPQQEEPVEDDGLDYDRENESEEDEINYDRELRDDFQ